MAYLQQVRQNASFSTKNATQAILMKSKGKKRIF